MSKLSDVFAANPNPTILMATRNVPRRPFEGFQFSPSQIDTFDDCERKWAFTKIDRVPREQNEAAAFGSRVHALREKWLRDGIMPSGDTFEVQVALVGLELLPMPKLGEVEAPIKRDVGFGFYLGYIDYFLEDQGAAGYWPPEVDWPYLQDGIPLVLDHKTTSDEQYAKTPDELIHVDAQGAMYGMDAFLRVPSSVDEVDLFWHYLIKKKKPKHIPVRARAKKSDIEANFEKQMETAKRMLSIFDTSGIVANDVAPTGYAKGVCDKYGGCPHRERCVISNQYKLGVLTMSTNGSDKLLEKLMAEAKTKGVDVSDVPLPTGAAKPTPMPVPAKTNGGSNSLAALGAALGNEDVSSEIKVPVVENAPPVSPKKKGSMASLMAAAGPQPQKRAVIATPTIVQASAKPTLADVAKQQAQGEEQVVVPPDAQAPDLDATPESLAPPKKKITRKKKSETDTLTRRDQFVLSVFSTLLQKDDVVDNDEVGERCKEALFFADMLLATIDDSEKK